MHDWEDRFRSLLQLTPPAMTPKGAGVRLVFNELLHDQRILLPLTPPAVTPDKTDMFNELLHD